MRSKKWRLAGIQEALKLGDLFLLLDQRQRRFDFSGNRSLFSSSIKAVRR
jgi:hypothetical protein